MLLITTWLWGTKWHEVYAARLFAGVDRNLTVPHRNILITDRPVSGIVDSVAPIPEADYPLLARPGCLARMRIFDPEFQKQIGAERADRIVNIDVDAVITGNIDHLFECDCEFAIMQGFNQTNPCPYNGSLWMFRAGERHDAWTDFGPDAHRKFNVPVHHIQDDQGWLHFKFPNAAAYTPNEGVYAFKKVGWPYRRAVPLNARFVAFPGRDPAKYMDVGWIRQNWRTGN